MVAHPSKEGVIPRQSSVLLPCRFDQDGVVETCNEVPETGIRFEIGLAVGIEDVGALPAGDDDGAAAIQGGDVGKPVQVVFEIPLFPGPAGLRSVYWLPFAWGFLTPASSS